MAELVDKEKEEKPKGEEGEGEDDGGDDGPAPEEESTATFTPVVNLQVIEVKTHEEEEDIVYKQRGKLFTYSESMLDKGTGKKNWVRLSISHYLLCLLFILIMHTISQSPFLLLLLALIVPTSKRPNDHHCRTKRV